MKYLLTSALLASCALATSTSVAYVTEMDATVQATITSCANNACATTATPILEPAVVTPPAVSVVTESDVSTTLVTVTSCSDNACATSLAPAAISVLTTTINALETVYTTYCPLTESSTSALAPAAVTPAPTSEGDVYVDVDVTVNDSLDLTVYEDVTAYVTAGDDVTYLDVTITPTSTTDVNAEATTSVGSTFTSIYSAPTVQAVAVSSSSRGNSSFAVAQFEGSANRVQNSYVAGVAAAAAAGFVLLGL